MEQKRFPVFAERFYQLRSERGMSQEEFADFLEITRPTVGFYENGKRIPDALKLRQIAEKCNVSADWLLGLTDAKTVDCEIRAICSKTGLSERIVTKIVKIKNSKMNEDGAFYGFIDELFTDHGAQFELVLYNLFDFKNALEARYIRHKLLQDLLLEELGICNDTDEIGDDAWLDAARKASKRSAIELEKLCQNSKYRKSIRECIAAQNFIESKLEPDNPLGRVFNSYEQFDISDMYKNRVIQWFMLTLEGYEDDYDADKAD